MSKKEGYSRKIRQNDCASWYGTNRTLLVQSWSIPAGQRNEASTRESSPCTQVKGIG